MDKNYIVILRSSQRLWIDGPTFIELHDILSDAKLIAQAKQDDICYITPFAMFRINEIAAVVTPEMLERPGLSVVNVLAPTPKKIVAKPGQETVNAPTKPITGKNVTMKGKPKE
jgi:hypothetical protein